MAKRDWTNNEDVQHLRLRTKLRLLYSQPAPGLAQAGESMVMAADQVSVHRLWTKPGEDSFGEETSNVKVTTSIL